MLHQFSIIVLFAKTPLSSEESSQIEQLLKTDEALKLQYDEIMQLRNLHAETMIPLLNPIMPAKTQTLINSLKKSETKSWSKFLSLGPLANGPKLKNLLQLLVSDFLRELIRV